MMKLCVTAAQVYEIAQKTKQKMQKESIKLSKTCKQQRTKQNAQQNK